MSRRRRFGPRRARSGLGEEAALAPARTWDQVAEEWNRRSGEKIGRVRAYQIGQLAMRKLRGAIGERA